MKNKKGFTLIELLVVVLIIGILAGIALPQYRNAVRKTRVAEARIILRALVDASDRYFLQHGNTGWRYDDLDIEISTESENWDIDVDECAGEGCSFYAEPKRETAYQLYYASQRYCNGEDLYAGKFICYAKTNDGKEICKQLGGVQLGNDSNSYYI